MWTSSNTYPLWNFLLDEKQETLLFSAAISAFSSYSMEPEQPCAALLPAAHLSQASGGAVCSQAVIPERSFLAVQFSRSGLWSCDPRWSRGCCPHHLLLFLSSAVVKGPHVPLTQVQPSLPAHRAAVQLPQAASCTPCFGD